MVITKCYKTVATESLCVLAGCLPLDLMTNLELDHYNMVHSNNDALYKIDFNLRGKVHNIDETSIEHKIHDGSMPLNTVCIYTDGSKFDTDVGCAYVVYNSNSKDIYYRMLK